LLELPPKVRQKVVVDMTPSYKKDMSSLWSRRRQLENARRQAAGPARLALDNELRTITTALFKLTGVAKLRGCLQYIEERLETSCKMLVFAHHQEPLDAAMDQLCKRKIRHIRIDGATPQHLRQQLCDRFQTDDECRVALLSITAAGVGLTLHAATYVVFMELYWNPGHILQAEDRAHRMGQQSTVDVKFLLCPGSLDVRGCAEPTELLICPIHRFHHRLCSDGHTYHPHSLTPSSDESTPITATNTRSYAPTHL